MAIPTLSQKYVVKEWYKINGKVLLATTAVLVQYDLLNNMLSSTFISINKLYMILV